MENGPISAQDINTASDVNEAIRYHWHIVCGEFPDAITPHIAKKVADDFGISVTRVFEAFTTEKDS